MILKTFDNHNINDTTSYLSYLTTSFYGLPEIEPLVSSRQRKWPVIGGINRPGKDLFILTYIQGDIDTLHKQLQQWFNPEDETPKRLVVSNALGFDVYVEAICTSIQENGDVGEDSSAGKAYVISLKVSGDIRWRSVIPKTITNGEPPDYWIVDHDSETLNLTNSGEDDAYPILKFTPKLAKTVGYQYKSWIPVRWNSPNPATKYSMDITNDSFNTQALVTASKMQIDGDDLRVLVDGVEKDRWLDGINTTTTKVWINLDFKPELERTLAVAIPATGAITEIVIIAATEGGTIEDFPASGILHCANETFIYTSKNNDAMTFYGITRAANGTSEAAHIAGTLIWWVQHDVWIIYGNSAVSAPTVDDDNKPMFSLASSTNYTWVYTDFWESVAGPKYYTKRAAVWTFDPQTATGYYGGNHGVFADPYVELGINTYQTSPLSKIASWKLYNPCTFETIAITNGEKYMATGGLANGVWAADVYSIYQNQTYVEYQIPKPTADITWQAWNYSGTLHAFGTTGPQTVAIRLYIGYSYPAINSFYLECADVTLTINDFPTITIGAEQGGYPLEGTLSISTSDDIIDIDFIMDIDQILEIDTGNKTVKYLKDNSNQFQALTLNSVRGDWFKFPVGAFTLTFSDVGTANLRIAISWQERWF